MVYIERPVALTVQSGVEGDYVKNILFMCRIVRQTFYQRSLEFREGRSFISKGKEKI